MTQDTEDVVARKLAYSVANAKLGEGSTMRCEGSLSDRIDVLRRELEAAGGIFRAYEALHLEKETEDGRRKAKINGAYAESIERTLAALHQEGTPKL